MEPEKTYKTSWRYEEEYAQKFPNLVKMMQKWEEAQAKVAEDRPHDKISSDDLPPYFMTLSDAIAFIQAVGFRVVDKHNRPLLQETLDHWESLIAKHSGE
jgi:hypothetical protein